MTPVAHYATWDEHRRAVSQAAEEARAQHAVQRPLIEIINEPESITISAQLPGFESDNIQIRSTDTLLTISASRDEYEGEGETLHSEWHSDVQRTIPLPVPTNPDNAEATYENGILKITFPIEEGQQVTVPIS